MSYDFALERLCSHRVLFETAELDTYVKDTIRCQRPMASNNIKVYIDGIDIPQGGLYTPSNLTSLKKEPYRIKSNVNDMIYIQVNNDIPRMIQLISGSYIYASDIASDLQKKIPELLFSIINGKLHIESRSNSDSNTFQFINPTWSDKTRSLLSTERIINGYNTLGIISGRKCIPKKIYSDWKIITDPNSYINEKVIKFTDPILNDSPYVQVSYITNRNNCRRCFGTQIEYDYGIMNNKYETIYNTDLLLQEFDKFLFTRSGSHWKWKWLGSKLIDRIGSKYITNGGVTNSFITVDITQAFKTYQSIKSQQDGMIIQQVSDSEYPLDFKNLSVITDQSDPTVAIIQGSIVSRSKEQIELKRVIGNPDPFFLGSGSAPLLQRG